MKHLSSHQECASVFIREIRTSNFEWRPFTKLGSTTSSQHRIKEPSTIEVRASESTVYLQADYVVPLHLPGFDFTLHFTPESGKRF